MSTGPRGDRFADVPPVNSSVLETIYRTTMGLRLGSAAVVRRSMSFGEAQRLVARVLDRRRLVSQTSARARGRKR